MDRDAYFLHFKVLALNQYLQDRGIMYRDDTTFPTVIFCMCLFPTWLCVLKHFFSRTENVCVRLSPSLDYYWFRVSRDYRYTSYDIHLNHCRSELRIQRWVHILGHEIVVFSEKMFYSCRDYVLFYICGCIYVYWCPTRFPCQMMFVSFNSNTTGVTSETGTADPFRSPWLHPQLLFGFVLLDL